MRQGLKQLRIPLVSDLQITMSVRLPVDWLAAVSLHNNSVDGKSRRKWRRKLSKAIVNNNEGAKNLACPLELIKLVLIRHG